MAFSYNMVFFNRRSETLLVFCNFWLDQALSSVNRLALSELGDLHKSVWDGCLNNVSLYNSDLVFVIR